MLKLKKEKLTSILRLKTNKAQIAYMLQYFFLLH